MSDDDLLPEHERVRAALADVPRPSTHHRDTAIARALVEFDRMHTAPNVVAFPQRRRWYRAVAAAAAVLVVGVVGLGALNGTSRNDSSSAGDIANTNGVLDATAGGAAATKVSAAGTMARDQAATAPAATINAITGAAEAMPQVASPDGLRVVAHATGNDTGITASEASVSVLPTSAVRISFTFSCTLDEHLTIVREITYQGTPAVLVRDTVTGMIQAIDAQCNVLATSAP